GTVELFQSVAGERRRSLPPVCFDAANIMRRILVDEARARGSAKRGGPERPVNLDDAPDIASPGRDPEIVALDDALIMLAELDPRKARVIELRFFGGLSVEETAEMLQISEQSVLRDWKLAKAWNRRRRVIDSGVRF